MSLMKAFVEIGAKLGPLKRGLAKAKAAVTKAVQAMEAAFKKMAAVGKKAFIGLAAVMGIASFAAIKQEKAEIALASALKVTGDFTEIAFQRFKDFAAQVQQTTVYGDEDTLMLMAMMKALGVTADKLELATRQAIGMAAATDRDVKSMAMYIALAIQGEFTMLRRYIPALRSATDETEQLAIITAFAARGFKLAQAQALTTAGALKQMKNAVGDLFEKIGEPFLDNITRAAHKIRDWSIANQDAINRVSASFDRLIGVGLRVISEFTRPLMNALSDLGSKFANFTTEAKIESAIWKVGEWADKILLRVKTLSVMISMLWKSNVFGEAIKFGLKSALAEFEKWGKQLLIFITGLSKNLAHSFSTNFGDAVSKRLINIADAIAPKSIGEGLKKYPITGLGRSLVGMGLYKASAAITGARLGNAPPSMEKVFAKMGAVTAREVPGKRTAAFVSDAFKNVIDKLDRQTEEKWKQIKQESENTQQLTKTLLDLNMPAPSGVGGAKAGDKAKFGTVGLREAWTKMVTGMQADPMIAQQKQTTTAIQKMERTLVNTLQNLSLRERRELKMAGTVGR